MTYGNQWLDAAVDLYEKKIARPSLWLGDDVHYEKALKFFGDDVVKMNTFVHRPYELDDIDYNGEYSDFFKSQNYLNAKDICLKMMDRLDLYGQFNRIDREVYFHKLTIWTLKKVYYSKPKFLIAAEAPHDHAKYIIYEILLFLNIPVFKFNCWTPAPLLFLQELPKNIFIHKEFKIDSEIDKLMDKYIVDYFNGIKLNNEAVYMRRHRLNSRLHILFINYFTKDIKKHFNDIKHNTWMLLKSIYNPINPYRASFIYREYLKFKRIKNLKKNIKKSVSKSKLPKKYVYFPLHYEPERTTNPDGGEFHDQFKAIVKLRDFLPDDFSIVVKEHPSQIYVRERGSRGRSPLFYNLLKSIKNLNIVDYKTNSNNLIKNAEIVATITGTVALEGAILGKKSITFGSVWYDGAPNIYRFSEQFSFDEFNNSQIHDSKLILDHLINQKNKYCIIALQNASRLKKHISLKNDDFDKLQTKGISKFIQTIIMKINSKVPH